MCFDPISPQSLPTGVWRKWSHGERLGQAALFSTRDSLYLWAGRGELLGRPCSQGLLGRWPGCVLSPDARSSEVSTPEASATVSPLSPRGLVLAHVGAPQPPALHTLSTCCVRSPAAPRGPKFPVTCKPALPTATTSSAHWAGGRPPAPLPTDEGGFLSLDTHRGSASWMLFL